MKKLTVTIIDPIGIHARPASLIVNIASKYSSTIKFILNQKEANAKSIINLMALGVKNNETIDIVTEGTDEEVALNSIIEIMKKEKLIA